jgi:hypothetical protein
MRNRFAFFAYPHATSG